MDNSAGSEVHRSTHLQTLFETSPDAIVLHDATGTILDVNEQTVENLGYKREELLRMTVDDVDVAYSKEELISMWDEMTVGDRKTTEGEHRRRDGSTFPVEVSIRKIELDGTARYLTLSRDITSRKEYERQLSTLHAVTRDLIDAKSKEDVAQCAVETANELLGFSLPSVWFVSDDGSELELVANTDAHQSLLDEADTPDPSHPSDSWLFDVLEAGETVVRNPIPTDDLAANVPLQSSIILPLGDHGILACAARGRVDFTDREITVTELHARNVRVALDQLDQNAALERQKQFTTELLDAIEDVVYVFDTDGDLLQWNESLETVTGYSSEETGSMNATDFFEGDDVTRFATAIEESFETGRTCVEAEFVTKSGTSIPYEFIANAFANPDGESVIAGIGRDRSRQVEYESQLEKQRDNLELLNQVVRHDIRNDLQLVLAYAESLKGRVDDTGQAKLDIVIESADHAVELTKTAREMSAVLMTSTSDRHPIELRSELEAELDEIRSTYSGAAITVDETIPRVSVLANDMLDSVFRNLLKNAIQHNDKEIPEVTVSVDVTEETAVVRIADNGPGIPDEEKQTIFGKGEKGLESDGTGVGLYLVETLVSAYGGEVWVEDNDPTGAVFVVELPVAEY